MKHYPYLIVGGGMTAAAAINGIREVDPDAEIGVIAAEPDPPYDRPPLSKGLWTGKKELADIWRDVESQATFHLGRQARDLDVAATRVTDDEGEVYGYDKLLLATGGRPIRLPFGGERIVYYRSLETYRQLRELAAAHDRFAVIGGGFIGSELAAALAMQGKQVTMIFPEPAISARLFPADLARFLNGYYAARGVDVWAGEEVADVTGTGTDLTVHTASGQKLNIQGVVAGIGIRPNTTLAEAAGLRLDDGILVDDRLRTSAAGVYAAGDVARYPDALLGVARRVEHEDAANSMGKAAGRIMAGADATYDYSPMFYSDLFDLGYEAIGELNSELETAAEWREPYRTGVVTYRQDGRLRGVLLWNVWDKVDQARQLIAAETDGARSDPHELVAAG
jgi:NADPH-dependent 2,4-dienoyl-CoA reductase/sulfur reductase-like enzyme